MRIRAPQDAEVTTAVIVRDSRFYNNSGKCDKHRAEHEP